LDTLAKAPVTGQMNLFIDQLPLDRGNSEPVSLDKSAPKFVDLFAGCGGLSLGLENSGFLPVFVNELSPDALGTYVRNRQKVNPLLGSKYQVRDVKQLVLDETLLDDLISGFKADYNLNTNNGDLDLLVGGPPCQGYSGIGHRRSYSVEREQLPSNHLYEDMAFIIARLRPKIFLFENVKGLLSARWTKQGEKGEIWDDVRSKFENIPGYQTNWSLVRAKDYATPQNRPRVLLVGIRDDLGINLDSSNDAVGNGLLPQPAGDSPHLEDLLGDLLDPAFENGGSTTTYPSDPQNLIQELLRVDPHLGTPLGVGSPVSEHEYSNHRPQVIKKFQYMLDHDGNISNELKTKKFAQRLLPRRWSKTGPSITATSLPDDYVHYEQPRVLSVREWAQLQMFPDWYEFSCKRTTGGIRRAGNPRAGVFDRELPKYTQIGNAVPVTLAGAIGRNFKRLLNAG
jgi:DNA (cytosine-5)-methyltransferase 1